MAEILQDEGGRVTFARFMELALTHPAEGYYCRADRVLGRRGDFSTAPSLSPAFNEAVASLLVELADASLSLRDAPNGARPGAGRAGEAEARPVGVVELGGGEGHLVQAVLGSWDRTRPDLRDRVVYCIVEVSAGLRKRQEEALEDLRNAGWDVRWGSSLREACRGVDPVVMIGNEFFDALPVHLVDVAGEILRESWVTWGAGPEQTWGGLSPEAAAEIELLFGSLDPDYLRRVTADDVIEVRPGVSGILAEVSQVMPVGSFVTIDYGDWYDDGPGSHGDLMKEYYRPAERVMRPGGSRRRTARGYFRHQMSTDLLARPGRQDLTADVDFRALDVHGRQVGFETVVFTSLAAFLSAGGAGQEPVTPSQLACCPLSDPLEADRQASVLDALLDDEGLGWSFKVMVQVRE